MHINKVEKGNAIQKSHVTELAHKFANEFANDNADFSGIENMVNLCIETGVVLFTDKGFIAGIPIHQFTNTGLTMIEFAWYAEDRSGLALLREFEKVSEELGCSEVHMTTLTQNPSADKLLERFEYKAFQTTWVKPIGKT